MDPVRNPYSPGAGAPPPALVGRDADLATCDVAIQRFGLGKPERSVLLTGLRGVGKTVLLREFGRLAEGHRWVHHAVEITEELKFVEEMSALAHGALRALSPGRVVVDRARRALGVLKSFQLKWKLPGEGDVVIGLDPVSGPADSGLLDRDLAGLLLEIGAVARARGVGILVTIDEVQNLPREHLGALMVALHRVSQEQLPIMVAAAGLPTVPGLVGEAKTYAERLFHFRTINSLADADARAALATPADAEGVRWRGAALDRALAETRGYPYFIQEFGKHAWDSADGPDEITADDVDIAVPRATRELDAGFFRVRIDRTSREEQAFLAVVASLGNAPHHAEVVRAIETWSDDDSWIGKAVADIKESTGGADQRMAERLRDSLIAKGLCYSPREGRIDFTVPLFGEFLHRQEGRGGGMESPLPPT